MNLNISVSENFQHQEKNIDALCKAYNVHKGTVKRWFKKQKIPQAYLNKDQFYTSDTQAKYCFEVFNRELKKLNINSKDYTFLEPSAGTGSFFKLLPKTKKLGMDIEPRFEGIKKRDYLKWTPQNKKKYLILGNPPFGLRGNMALKFINHSFDFVDVIGFILPQLFESDGKGSPMKRVKAYKLAYTEKLKDNIFYDHNTRLVKINVIFQVWTKINLDKVTYKQDTCRSFIKVYSLSNGGTPESTRNKKMLKNCDVYLPSTCFNGMKAYKSFKELPNKRGYGVVIKKEKNKVQELLESYNWQDIAFKSTNSALNLRTSLIEKVLIKKGFIDVYI